MQKSILELHVLPTRLLLLQRLFWTIYKINKCFQRIKIWFRPRGCWPVPLFRPKQYPKASVLQQRFNIRQDLCHLESEAILCCRFVATLLFSSNPSSF